MDDVPVLPQSLGHDCAVSPQDLTHWPSPHLPHAAPATKSQPPEFDVTANPKPPYNPEPMATAQIVTAMRNVLRKFNGLLLIQRLDSRYKCNARRAPGKMRLNARLSHASGATPTTVASTRQAHGS
jgi:hypothetical protein